MQEEERTEDAREEAPCPAECPFAKLADTCRNFFDRQSEFRKHMRRSRIEFLRGMRALIDERIRGLEEEDRPSEPKKATRIVVEET